MPLVAPFWLTATARMTAWTASPLAIASDRRFKTTTPTPSDRVKPWPSAAKEWQRPSGDRIAA